MKNGRKLAKQDSKKPCNLPEKQLIESEQKIFSQTEINIDFIPERIKLVKEAMRYPKNLIRTEVYDGHVTAFYNVEKSGKIPVTEL